ncbi:S41 family peptidase [Streptomyces diastatochromogenes]|uniref:Protease n=1 Tax=Streptomyces diastatochromogenes TaxID=42236 RepID=A0A233RWI5_STRDA|nr:S41 family peptidase [Streptomyces diastatochromogenes]MCZ0991422.1 S41 family peptidase [Streptomyces diastatochromogenes]OXY87764.1 protease [Streptomyces diastatochromogenes]
MRIVTATVVALTLTAAAAPTAAAAARPGTDGVWRMDGYGTVVTLGGGVLQEYQTTSAGCVEGDTSRQTGPGTYTTTDGTVLTVRTVHDRDHAVLAADSSVGHRGLRRIGALPADCTRALPDDPRTDFDVFWQTFEENYPFFAAKGVDWHTVRDRYRPQVHKDTTRQELFDIFSRMVRPLHDAHVAIQDGDRVFYQVRPGTELPSEELDAKVKKFIVARDLKDAPYRQDFADGRITYADLPGGQGYLRISGFGGYAGQDAPYSAEQAELDRALNTILTPDRVRRLTGLIIDLRINGGGSDTLGIRIAQRLTDTPYIAYSKRARNDPADPTRHTRPEPVPVVPADTPRYTGPVAVLTGGSTVSAGETFTQALLDRPGRTVRIGQPTQGVFSDVMLRHLPDGMLFGLPNEEYLTRAGRTFDGTGIPPQLSEPVFTKEEFDQGRDSAFDRAVRTLPSA